MKSLFGSHDLSEPTRRRLELAIAVAQERLLGTHVKHALRLIQLVGEQVPFENALNIYTRLLRLSEDEARVITTRALATLGEHAAETDVWPEFANEPAPGEANGEPNRRSMLEFMRHRLRGRVHDDLRRWVEMAAARTEVAILEVHVDNAMQFVDLLQREMPATEAVELYLDALEVRESISEVAYYYALGRLADEQLPEMPLTPGLRPTANGPEPAREDEIVVVSDRKLQVVESDRDRKSSGRRRR